MPAPNTIADYFKRPRFSINYRESLPKSDPVNDEIPKDPSDSPPSRPLTDRESSFQSPLSSPQSLAPPSSFEHDTSESRASASEGPTLTELPSSKNVAFAQPPSTFDGGLSFGESFAGSQRVIKNGKEMVISSDGEDTESIESLEAPEDLFKRFANHSDITQNEKVNRGKRGPPATASKSHRAGASTQKYKFSMDSLVTDAVNDQETEAGVVMLKATLGASRESNSPRANSQVSRPVRHGKDLSEDMLASALDKEDDERELQRVLDAVRRTEAFDREKSWRFFDPDSQIPAAAPAFPRSAFSPARWEAVMREPRTRERAFLSGMIEVALSRNMLPDELLRWIFQSVPSEPRDDLRHAYCRIFKHATAERINQSISPDDVDDLFRHLGARNESLALSQPMVPDSLVVDDDSGALTRKPYLMGALRLLWSVAESFSFENRERALHLLFRLSIDETLTADAALCSEVERTITAMLENASGPEADELLRHLARSMFETVTDATFQSRLMRHILPTSAWIAFFRCRLALAFLLQDASPLEEPVETLLDIKRITNLLKTQRFNVKAPRGKGHLEFDYGELSAITVLLNVAIGSGWARLETSEGKKSSAAEEAAYNAEVDALAGRIKKIFSSIEDSGASHLKRTQAKEALEALHYRVLYSVRTKPPPKKSFFGTYGRDDWKATSRSGSFMDRFLAGKSETDKKIPIRVHEDGA